MNGTAHEARGSAAVRPSPVFLAVVGATVLCGLVAWRYGTILERPGRVAVFGFVISAWILSLCLHEFGHAYMAYRSGDRSVAAKGYLTLNPLKYSDVTLSFLIPVVFIVLGGIGLPGGAVWIERHAIRGRLRHSLISAAGPLSNALFAVMLAVIFKNFADKDHALFWSGLAFLAFLQVTAAVLNLLPIPGLDGFGIIEPYLPRRFAAQASAYGGYAFLILIALLWLGPINEGFFNVIFYLTDAIGLDGFPFKVSGSVDNFPIELGHYLFQFWRG
ncbi:Zn-dependent protease (includes SpoIVFB) [Actinomadura meyerae]|jgi:Zn-dependent protease|uniref:Zn-dependent protease (Includes SpoIVFB) n=1 Tax=Actinomadura meyerae TaxID=240840 RepID=A0A239IM87_9ACTN|nr:site-2 protease family protein [Actinomadura meyerae]SNS94328.1 Zn-dependent protease (includes SpoIVFB) [Actinomadura meyerae]